MRTSIIHAIILIAIGIAAFGYQGFANTSKKKAVDLDPPQQTITAEIITISTPLSQFIGVITLVGGIGLLIMVSRKN
nr:DUF3185 domain-containing protein [Desulfobulbaceae bacterium]